MVATLALGCAFLLHLAPDRPFAVRLLPVAYLWGALAVGIGVRLPDAPVAVMVLAALVVRAPLVGTPLHLSDDLYRYLWEGMALGLGHNVFVEAPASIAHLDPVLAAKVNHAELPSVYPPVALAWFRVLAVFGTPTAAQALTALVDATLPASIRAAGGRPAAAWVYALHPLPAIESASGAHIDVIAVALAAAALAAWARGSRDLAWAALVAGALAKLFPGVLAPVLLRAVSPRRAAVWVALGGGATALGLLAAVGVPDHVPVGLAAYAGRWSFDGLLFPWLEPLFGGATRPILVAGAGLVAAGVWVRVADPARAWALIGAAFVAATPTMHPWYGLWFLVPALIVGVPGAGLAVVPLLGAYTVLLAFDPATGAWSEAPWLWWVTWPPALGVLAVAHLADQTFREDRPTAP